DQAEQAIGLIGDRDGGKSMIEHRRGRLAKALTAADGRRVADDLEQAAGGPHFLVEFVALFQAALFADDVALRDDSDGTISLSDDEAIDTGLLHRQERFV